MRDFKKTISDLRSFNANYEANKLTNDAADAIEELLAENKAIKQSNKDAAMRNKLLCDEISRMKEKVPHWISVEDEPPKENGRYLVRYKRDVDLGDETVHEDDLRIMRFFAGEGWRYPLICSDNVRLLNEEVTHWMPLPEPPKEEHTDA